ncbi:MAG: 30S ribosomal protein S1 [Planctomyces sp.]|nr:30S ribosomal protein S1 [Planctomyces sp.]
MVDRHLLREFSVDESELDAMMAASFPELSGDDDAISDLYDQKAQAYDINQILTGTIVRVDNEEVVVDIGYKSEGVVQRDEWSEEEEQPQVGQSIVVLLEEFEDSIGLIVLSKRKADRVREWENIIRTHKEGDIVKGTVVRKIKGGLLINIGVNVFLPASQVDIRRPSDIADYIGQEIECMILKIDEARRNIVVSRRRLIEEEREKMKKALLSDLQIGQVRKGTVKNIADFGAFVDLGGIDGLLHITDMSWGRISHPTEMVKIDDEVEVMVLNIDYDKEKIALGLKQKSASPWANISDKYPVGSKVQGEVVNVLSYGAFVKLEDGIEGLVHISEMSWTRRVNHPSELVAIGDKVEVMVLGINQEKQEISLGMKQTQPNPWDEVAAKYPPGSLVKGTVRNLTNYGAFVELQEGVDGLLHISDMSWTRKVSHANEMLKKGDPIECQILSVDEDRRRIALGLKQLTEDPWETRIPEKYAPGSLVTGKVTKITNFGVFVQLEDELEGLLHVSELADHKVEHPESLVTVGQELEVRILRVDTADRKIGLSRRAEPEKSATTETTESTEDTSAGSGAPKAREELKGGMGSSSGPLFTLGGGQGEEN